MSEKDNNFLLNKFNNLNQIRNNVKKKTKKDSEIYLKLENIGRGAYGVVDLIQSKKTGIKYVMKTIEKLDKENEEQATTEALLLRKMDHPNIIKFKEVFRTKNKNGYKSLNIITEFAEGGDLFKLLCKHASNGVHFHENQLIDWLTQTCNALNYIHSKHIIHRDIKPHNIFLSKHGLIKLGDFGVSKNLTNTIEKAETFIGTTQYLPPELINNEPYSYKADIWSLGVTFYQLMTFKPPFDGQGIPAILKKISDSEKIEEIPKTLPYSSDFKNLIYKMLKKDPSNRPSAKEILNFPIIRKRANEFLKENKYVDNQSAEYIKNYQNLNKITFNFLENKLRKNSVNSGDGTETKESSGSGNSNNKACPNNINFVNNNEKMSDKSGSNKSDDSNEKNKVERKPSHLLSQKVKIIFNTKNSGESETKNESKRLSSNNNIIKIKKINTSDSTKTSLDEIKKKVNIIDFKQNDIKNTVCSNAAILSDKTISKLAFNLNPSNCVYKDETSQEINLLNAKVDLVDNEKQKEEKEQYDLHRTLRMFNSTLFLKQTDQEVEEDNNLILHGQPKFCQEKNININEKEINLNYDSDSY